jgi:hypothetical protein
MQILNVIASPYLLADLSAGFAGLLPFDNSSAGQDFSVYVTCRFSAGFFVPCLRHLSFRSQFIHIRKYKPYEE